MSELLEFREDLRASDRSAFRGGIDFLFATVIGRRVLDHRNPAPRFGLRPPENMRPRTISFAHHEFK